VCYDEQFRFTWEAVEETGGCDGWDGCECRRVYAEWIAAGRPPEIASFIREAANRPVDSPFWVLRQPPQK
jgi:hypothetical protein